MEFKVLKQESASKFIFVSEKVRMSGFLWRKSLKPLWQIWSSCSWTACQSVFFLSSSLIRDTAVGSHSTASWWIQWHIPAWASTAYWRTDTLTAVCQYARERLCFCFGGAEIYDAGVLCQEQSGHRGTRRCYSAEIWIKMCVETKKVSEIYDRGFRGENERGTII